MEVVMVEWTWCSSVRAVEFTSLWLDSSVGLARHSSCVRGVEEDAICKTNDEVGLVEDENNVKDRCYEK